MNKKDIRVFLRIIVIIAIVLVLEIPANNGGYYHVPATQGSSYPIVSGTVYDVNNNTISGVRVRIHGTAIESYTDINGTFSLVNVPMGNLTIVASRKDMHLTPDQWKFLLKERISSSLYLHPLGYLLSWVPKEG